MAWGDVPWISRNRLKGKAEKSGLRGDSRWRPERLEIGHFSLGGYRAGLFECVQPVRGLFTGMTVDLDDIVVAGALRLWRTPRRAL
jgi:hypothetical protein